MTVAFAEFAAGQRPESIPAKALAAARMGMTDLVGCMFAGLEQPAVKAIRGALLTVGVLNEARICLGAERASSPEAALAMTAAGGVLDFDDVALKGSHPSSILTAALLCEAERIGASGRDVVAAYATGFEVWARVIDREADPYIEKGWHTTSVIGAARRHGGARQSVPADGGGGDQRHRHRRRDVGGPGGELRHLCPALPGRARGAKRGAGRPDGQERDHRRQDRDRGGQRPVDRPVAAGPGRSGNADGRSRQELAARNGRPESQEISMALATHRAFDGMQDLVAAHGLKLDEVSR